MSDAEREILARLARLEALLSQLVAPVEVEEARQLLTCTDEQRKAHNKMVRERAKATQKQQRRA